MYHWTFFFLNEVCQIARLAQSHVMVRRLLNGFVHAYFVGFFCILNIHKHTYKSIPFLPSHIAVSTSHLEKPLLNHRVIKVHTSCISVTASQTFDVA